MTKKKTTKVRTCDWRQEDVDSSVWATDCGGLFCINDGTPTENNMDFCCFCGKKLAECKPETSDV